MPRNPDLRPAGWLILLALAAPVQAAPAAAPAEDTTNYIVQPRDTLYAFARRYLLSLKAITDVRRINNITNPRRLQPGSSLAIPSNLLRSQPLAARVEAVSGAVSISNAANASPQPVVLGAAVPEGATLQTQGNAFVTLRFTDGSRVSLPSNSIVRIQASRRVVLGDAVQRRFDIRSGRGTFEVVPVTTPGDRFEVRTPMAVSAVRGTEFRVGYRPESQASTLEVLDGRVAEAAADGAGSTPVDAGFAALRLAGAATATLVKLSPAPDLADPGRVQSDPAAAFAIAEPKTGNSYRFLLARDAGFIENFAELTSDNGRASFDNVENGTFFVRATTIDANGIEGRPVTYSFDRQRSSIEASVAPPAATGPRQYVFKWSGSGEGQLVYRFVLARDAAMTDAIVDEAGLTGTCISVTALPAGTYYWQVSMVQSVGNKSFRRSLPANELRIASRR